MTGSATAALDAKGLKASEGVEDLAHKAQEEWIPRNGARMVARAWVDPEYRKRLLANGREAALEMGFMMPKHHRHLVVLENGPKLQNVICCTLCSCTAFTLIGLWIFPLQIAHLIVTIAGTIKSSRGEVFRNPVGLPLLR